MAEPQNSKPLLTVTSRVSPADAEKAARNYRLIQTAKLTAVFVAVLILASAVITLYHGLPLTALPTVLRDSHLWLYVLLYIVLALVSRVWYMPRRARRTLTEIYGDAPYWEMRYDLYDDCLHVVTETKKSNADASISYADIRRIRRLPYQILMRTRQRSLFAINTLGMSGQDAQALLDFLKKRVS